MAQYRIPVSEVVIKVLDQQVEDIAKLQFAGELPTYPEFNKNLMKDMPTVPEELHHAATSIAGEAGEILDISKKVWVYNKPLDIEHLIEELGDLRFYYQSMLYLLSLQDEHIVAANMVKLRKRYADGKYSDTQANARADKQPLSAVGKKGVAEPSKERTFLGSGNTITDSKRKSLIEIYQGKDIRVVTGEHADKAGRVIGVDYQGLLEVTFLGGKGLIYKVNSFDVTIVELGANL